MVSGGIVCSVSREREGAKLKLSQGLRLALSIWSSPLASAPYPATSYRPPRRSRNSAAGEEGPTGVYFLPPANRPWSMVLDEGRREKPGTRQTHRGGWMPRKYLTGTR